ncbi:sensor histidine kinase [Thiohalomonas denitrificans]|uniref:histidine kinase n=1 Tax=Thiohalomonas denitrificans TaxID=415747 RepID=A0A1G5Q6D7_9GAMM|nr:ATP-binding protein [Thiohalomonas denitrificans]SCZ57178.1 HAMP domain-containing protein [Thiohalomonas denitrificans]
MFKSLYARLAFVLALLLIVVGAVVSAFAVQASATFLQELDQRFNRDLARQLLVQRNLVGADRLDGDTVKSLFSHYMHVNPAIEIYLLDSEGTIVAYEAPQMKIKRNRVDLAPIKRFLDDAPLPILGDDPRQTNGHKAFSAAAFPFRGPTQQYLYVVLGGESFSSARKLLQESYLVRFSLFAVVGVVLFGILAGAVAFHQLTRRLRGLTKVMDGFRASDFDTTRQPYIVGRSGDEIDRLGTTFNAMAARIEEQVGALEEKDVLRRNLVANVSHDLRTPLASLQGYLETLQLKAGELSTEEYQRYLGVAHRQSERLTCLVEELFELSRLDAREALPESEPVALGELIQDAAQKYGLRAEQQNLTFRASIAQDLPPISGDVGLLDRVLENLLGNALRHTPEQGEIDIHSRLREGRVEVDVVNTGPTIPAEELPHVFERFYQSPSRHHGGAGLGLAIVKRIVELHGGDVAADSANGRTRFTFHLPTG